MKIHIEGLNNARGMLNRFSSGINEKLSKGIGKGCEIVKGEAKAICPVSTEKTRPGGPHGELKHSISSRVDGLRGEVFTLKNYAMYVEFGTYKMRAQPYLVPALKSREADVIAAVKAQFGV